MLRTRLCELVSIEVPIVGAPMGPEIASLELAAAISNAGGLGMISFGGYPTTRVARANPQTKDNDFGTLRRERTAARPAPTLFGS